MEVPTPRETYILIRWPLSPVLLLQGIELTQASGRLDSLPYPQHLLPSAALEDLQNSMVFASSSPSPPPGCPRTTDREGDGPRTGSSGHCPRRSAGGHLLGTRLKPHALPLTVRSTWNTGSDVHPAKGFSTCRSARCCSVSIRGRLWCLTPFDHMLQEDKGPSNTLTSRAPSLASEPHVTGAQEITLEWVK
ncbi:unnamed protein product [Rangifer tarandus platyrhynchus]|uniref:Uncharacterized protein n=2 Tax=Rangifer tarandus platyrhynchus TaxID=3082113 RepID=A0ACB0F1U6_RANTA|nr:unnamed protein product [Rangifer tarandus platyrhynchus]CAI9707093.1 unnamed protein product [Rangifer tarandus platyrhynchus]